MKSQVINKSFSTKNQTLVTALIYLTFAFSGCVHSFQAQELFPEPMPAFDEDVLWVSSVPLGAKVVVFEKEKGQIFPLNPDKASDNKPFMSMSNRNDPEIKHKIGAFAREIVGTTPLKLELPPGTYCVGVQLDVASENIHFSYFDESNKSEELSELTKAYTDADIFEIYENLGTSDVGYDIFDNPTSYLQDGNLEMWGLYNKGHLKQIGKTYEIEKKEGEPVTVIALFQRHNEDPDKVYNMLPPEYQFNKREALMPGLLEVWGVPKKESKRFHKRLHHGGKAMLCDPEGDHIMVELTSIKIKVSENRQSITGGHIMSIAGKYLDRE